MAAQATTASNPTTTAEGMLNFAIAFLSVIAIGSFFSAGYGRLQDLEWPNTPHLGRSPAEEAEVWRVWTYS